MKQFRTRRSLVALVVLSAAVATAIAAATASARTTHAAASIKACALLPDTTSSTRYTLFDAPYLTKAFKAAGIPAQVLNAHNDPQKQKSQAEQCLAEGAKVILLDPLNPASGGAITTEAVGRGAKVIDYDRLVVHSKATLYVSHNSVKVGELQAKGLIAALKSRGKYGSHPVVAELNGGITDNNAHLFKQGYDSVLKPLYKKGTLKLASSGDQWTDWSAVKGQTIFEQMLARNGNKIDAVLAANDGLAGAVISTLKNKGLKPIPVTGQDATPTGVQYILAGWQTGTVYKSVKVEAATAAKAAITLLKGKKVKSNTKVSGTPSILLNPVWVTKRNYKLLFKENALKKSQVCVGQYKKYC